MDIKFSVKRKYVVNGKEYASPEEMPAAIREAYEKAVGKAQGMPHGNISSVSSGEIVFNGQEYESVDSMPLDVRQMYETVMKTVSEGKISVTGDVDFKSGKRTSEPGKGIPMDSFNIAKPIEPQLGFSPRILIITAAILGFIIGLYVLMSIGGFR